MRAVALVDRGMGDGGHLATRRLGSGRHVVWVAGEVLERMEVVGRVSRLKLLNSLVVRWRIDVDVDPLIHHLVALYIHSSPLASLMTILIRIRVDQSETRVEATSTSFGPVPKRQVDQNDEADDDSRGIIQMSSTSVNMRVAQMGHNRTRESKIGRKSFVPDRELYRVPSSDSNKGLVDEPMEESPGPVPVAPIVLTYIQNRKTERASVVSSRWREAKRDGNEGIIHKDRSASPFICRYQIGSFSISPKNNDLPCQPIVLSKASVNQPNLRCQTCRA